MKTCLALLILVSTGLVWADQAGAVPSYGEQTGQPCSACHIGGFGPQLTPFGRQFKLGAYAMRGGEKFTLPFSAIAAASYIHTNADQPSPPAPHYSTNDNATIDNISAYVAGGFGDHFGALTQWSYDGVGRSFTWDMLDIRAATKATVSGSDVVFGVALDNAPGLDDLWNTLPAFGFPYTDSDLAPAPMAQPVFDGELMQTVLGTNAYVFWDSTIFATVGAYWTPGRGFLRAMGTSAADMGGSINGMAPYIRVAYQKDYGNQNFEVGAFAFLTDLYPGGDSSMGADRHNDLGLDASYQYLADPNNTYTLNTRYTHEQEDLNATFLMGGATNLHDSLNEVNLDAGYSWHNTLGGTVGLFDTWGSKDMLLYMDSRTSAPDSSGVLLEADYTPFGESEAPINGRFSLRFGLQYRIFTKFDGTSSNYDGLGHNASDNDTLRLFMQMML